MSATGSSPTVGVIGAGAWGTALAQMLASDGREVLLWAREEALVEEIIVNSLSPCPRRVNSRSPIMVLCFEDICC